MVMLTRKILLLIRLLNIVRNMLCEMMMNHNFDLFFSLLNPLGHFIDYLYRGSMRSSPFLTLCIDTVNLIGLAGIRTKSISIIYMLTNKAVHFTDKPIRCKV